MASLLLGKHAHVRRWLLGRTWLQLLLRLTILVALCSMLLNSRRIPSVLQTFLLHSPFRCSASATGRFSSMALSAKLIHAVIATSKATDGNSSDAAAFVVAKHLSTVPRPCGQHVEHRSHFVERPYWQTLSAQERQGKRQAWQEFRSRIAGAQMPSGGAQPMQGRGIVYTAGSTTFQRALVSIRMLRHKHLCTLPIEVWHMGGGELDANALAALNELGNVRAMDLAEELQRISPDSHGILAEILRGSAWTREYGAETGRNYHIKTLVLLLSHFQHVLYLDSDNFPLRDPSNLFDTDAYRVTGALFWPDLWKFPADNPMWDIAGIACEEEYEQESGQLVLDKRRVWEPLLMSLHFQMQHRFYFTILLGDKDTFRFAWKVTGFPYHMIPYPLALAGRVRHGRFCGYSMVQHDPEGKLLFMHANLLKHSFAKRGVTWETLQYFEQVKGDLSSSSRRQEDGRLDLVVDYPVTREYAGGAEDPYDAAQPDGPETAVNPCLDHQVLSGTHLTTTHGAVESWGWSDVAEHYRVSTVDFRKFDGGSLQWVEDAFYDYGAPNSRSQYEHRE